MTCLSIARYFAAVCDRSHGHNVVAPILFKRPNAGTGTAANRADLDAVVENPAAPGRGGDGGGQDAPPKARNIRRRQSPDSSYRARTR
jgi:hypothetical protein